jgi:hypothetical protein
MKKICLHMNLGLVLSKLVQKNLNYIIPRDGEGDSFNKKPNHPPFRATLHPTELRYTLLS